MTVLIRQATAADADEIYAMIRELARYEKEENSVVVTAADLRRQLSQENPPFVCCIAEMDGKPCGFAVYSFAYSTWEGTRTLSLEDLYVRAEFRGTGAGVALMSFLAHTAHQHQCRRFEWSVLDWNQSAINFYERLGAKPMTGWTRYRMDADSIAALSCVS